MFHIQDILEYSLPGLAATILFLVCSEIFLRIKNEQITWFRRMTVLITGLYLTAVFALTVSPQYGFSITRSSNSINWIPLQVLDSFFINPWNFWGNIIMFVPFGISLVFLSNKYQKLRITLFAGAGLSLLIELLQLFDARSTDIDDIILNTTGTLCGYLLGKLILSAVPTLHKKIGIIISAGGKHCKKPHDTGGIAVLTIFVLASVFLTGFSKTCDKTQNPEIPPENNPAVSTLPSRVYNTKVISADIAAKNVYFFNVSSNTLLYEKGSRQRIAPASTAKMLTALTVLDYCNQDEKVLVGQEIQRMAQDASRAWLCPGDKLTVRQLLDALLLPSGNDAAYALAVFTGKKICKDDAASIDKALTVFIAAMNKKAAKIGAVHSNFTTPDGYDADGQYTTAQDLACIARKFLKTGVLRGIASSYRISNVLQSGKEVTYYNTNELINPQSKYYYKCITGLKTGKSKDAGCCLVSSAYMDGELYLCVVMGSTEEGRWTDSLALYHAIK